jgi:hypothetical protein
LEILFLNKHLFAKGSPESRVPGRAEGPATDERTRSSGWGQDPNRKGDKVSDKEGFGRGFKARLRAYQ